VWVLDFVIVVAGVIGVISAPFLLIGWSNYLSRRPENRVFPVKSALFFVVPLLVAALAYGTSTLIAQCQVAEFFASVSDHYTISVDGRPMENRDQVLVTLKEFADLPAHHSHPTRELQVEISDPPRRMRLWLGRDSDDPHEYWVFASSPSKLAARAAMKKDIGHVKTSVFDAY